MAMNKAPGPVKPITAPKRSMLPPRPVGPKAVKPMAPKKALKPGIVSGGMGGRLFKRM